MTAHNPDYVPNPDRAIHVQGVIDQQMVYRLAPQIVSLQHQGRDPITIFIDSPAGIVGYKDSLVKLLNASNQDFATPCRIITGRNVVGGKRCGRLVIIGPVCSCLSRQFRDVSRRKRYSRQTSNCRGDV